jgi:uncharacterized protein
VENDVRALIDRLTLAAGAGIVLLLIAGCHGRDGPPDHEDCRIGTYHLDDGRVLAISPHSTRTLRYTFLNGETAPLDHEPDGSYRTEPGAVRREPVTIRFDCATGTLQLDQRGSAAGGAKLAYRSAEIRFPGRDAVLLGRLVLPEAEAAAVVVLVHGSEAYSAVYYDRLQHLLPAQGVGVFVYDKRGTGRSGGRYTQDFDVLADDAVAAYRAVLPLVADEDPQVGFLGGSQGGWVAPLAATRVPARFVIAAFGLAESPLAEDREEVLNALRKAGYGDDVLAAAREITDATGRVMASRFRDGYRELAAVKRKYRDAPWLPSVEGEFTGDLLRYPRWLLRLAGPWFDRGTSWTYEPVPTLRALEVPQLWILAGEDEEAPSATTFAILRELQAEQAGLDIAFFPAADHGMWEFIEAGDGTRHRTRISDGYYALLARWAVDRTFPDHPTFEAVPGSRPAR